MCVLQHGVLTGTELVKVTQLDECQLVAICGSLHICPLPAGDSQDEAQALRASHHRPRVMPCI